MDIKSIVKKLDINWLKVISMNIFNKAALYEYALDKANTAVNMLLNANAGTIQTIREKIARINARLVKYSDYIPAPWLPDAQRINQLLLEIFRVTDDSQITSDEFKGLAEKFQIAYSQFKSED